MAFDYRRLLLPLKKTEIDPSCYTCYGGCPDYCSSNTYPSPVEPPPPLPASAASQSHRFSTILAITLGVLGLALVFLSYLTIRGYRIRSRRNSSNTSQPSDRFRDDENQGPVLDHPIWYIRTVGFPQSAIDSIAAFKYVKGEGIIEGSDCAICLSEFREDESLRLLPKCSHAFHLPCVDTWLRSHKNCPVCRAPVMNNTVAADGNTSGQAAAVDVSTGTRNWESGVVVDQNHQAGESGGRGNGVEEAGVNDRQNNTLVLRSEDDYDDVPPLKSVRFLSDEIIAHYDHHEPLRRSVSMDFLPATSSSADHHHHHHHHHHLMNSSFSLKKEDEGCSELGVIVEKQDDSDIIEGKGLDCNSSSNKCSSSSQKAGPVLMLKRSLSFSGRSLWKNHSSSFKSVESITIPES